MGVLAKRVIIYGAINPESGAETTTPLATTAGMQKRRMTPVKQANSAGMVPIPAGQLHIHLIRKVSDIDHGAGNGLAQNVSITALSLGSFR
jgi:hypothetical protein